MPKWLKILLIVVAIAPIVGTTAILGGICYFVPKLLSDVQNPTKIKAVASSFLKMKEPLPEGFDYKAGFALAGNKFVVVVNSKCDLTMILASIQDPKGDLRDPDKAIEKFAAANVHINGSQSSFQLKKKERKRSVGEKCAMHWAIQATKRKEDFLP